MKNKRNLPLRELRNSYTLKRTQSNSDIDNIKMAASLISEGDLEKPVDFLTLLEKSITTVSALGAIITSYADPIRAALRVLSKDRRLTAYNHSIEDLLSVLTSMQSRIDVSLGKSERLSSSPISFWKEVETILYPLADLIKEATNCAPGGVDNEDGFVVASIKKEDLEELKASNSDVLSKFRFFTLDADKQ